MNLAPWSFPDESATLRAFHGDATIREKYIKRVRKHRLRDELVKGFGWERGKGCAIGCTLEAYDHNRYPIELGLPTWIAHLEDAIFENLPSAEAQLWPERFLEAITPGANVDLIKHKLIMRRIDRLIKFQTMLLSFNSNYSDNVSNAITLTIAALRQARVYHSYKVMSPYGICSRSFPDSCEAAKAVALKAATEAAAGEFYTEGLMAEASVDAVYALRPCSDAINMVGSGSAVVNSICFASEALSVELTREEAWMIEAFDLLELLRELRP